MCRRGLAGTCANSRMLRKAGHRYSERPLAGRTCTELGAQNEGDFQQSHREEQTKDYERPTGVSESQTAPVSGGLDYTAVEFSSNVS